MTAGRKIIYAFIAILLFFVILEIVLLLVGFSGRADDTTFVLNPEWDYPEYFLKDHDLFWRFRPNQIIKSDFFVEGEYHINNHGLRGPDFSREKTPGVYRIVCLGNSCTFGWRVGEQQVYARQLADMLKRSDPARKYEIINAGVTGYTSLQGLRFLRRDVLNWQPDLLVVSYGWNDHWAAAREIADKNQVLPSQWVLDIQNLLGRTRTYRWLKYLVFSIKNPPPAEFSRTNPVYRVGLADCRDNLQAIIDEAKSRGIDVALLTLPIAERADPRFKGVAEFHEKYNAIIRSLGSTDSVAVIDAAAAFSGRNNLFNQPRSDLKHYNANGHMIIASMIQKYILQR